MGATALLVDDELEVLALTKELLELNGYAVLDASSPEEALRIAERHEGRIDLLITDVVMPGLRGPELASRVARLRPGIRVLYVSAFVGELPAGEGPLAPGAAFLPKPFSEAALVAAVADALRPGN